MKVSDRLRPGLRDEPAWSGDDAADTDLESGPAPGAERYHGNPQLAVIESYALDVIGELSAEEIEEAEHAVVELYGDSPDWRGAVRRRLGWTALVDSAIAEGWHRFRTGARQAGEEAEPAEFARRFADEVVRLSRS
jgi:hypothetical protein